MELVGTALAVKDVYMRRKTALTVLGVLVPLWAGSLSKVIPNSEVCVSLQQVNRTAASEAAPLPGWESVLG